MTRLVAEPLAAAAGVLAALLVAGALLAALLELELELLQAASSAAPTDAPSAAHSRTVPACRVRVDAVTVIVSCRSALSRHNEYGRSDESA